MSRRTTFSGLMIAVALSVAILGVYLARCGHDGKTERATLSDGTILNQHDGFLWAVAFSPDGKILACFNTTFIGSDESSTVDVWEVATGRKVATLEVAFKHPLAFSPDGKALATGHGNYTIRLWDTATWQDRAKQFPPGIGAPVFWLNDGTIATNGWDGQLVCDLATGKSRRITDKYVVEATQVAFAQNGKLMALAAPDSRATGPERTIELWDVVSGNMLWSVEAHVNSAGGGAPRCVAFAPDGRNLASGGSDRLVRIWDVTGKKEVASYLTNRPAITSVAFSPDGRLLAAGDDATPELPCEVLLWDLATGERLGVWKTHSGVRQIAFSPDGKTLAVGSSDMKGFVELWSVEEMLGKKGK